MNKHTNNNYGAQHHMQIGGLAFYDEGKYFFFAPDVPVPGSTPKFRRNGVAQQMSDGSFDFTERPLPRSQSKLIHKLAHGRVSETKDGAIQLTLKVFAHEGVNISDTLRSEAFDAAQAVMDFQLKR